LITSRAIENQIDDENLLALCLGINDDINQTNKRYDDYRAHRKPAKFVSCFTRDYAHLNKNNNNQSNNNQTSSLLDFGGSNNNNNNINSTGNINTNQQGGKVNDLNEFFDMFK
jgi:hypothetical protein